MIGECLAPRGRRILAGLHPSFRQAEHLPFVGTVSRWGGDEIEERSFLFNPDGHGLRLNRVSFDADLRRSAEAAGAGWWTVDRLLSSVRCNARWRLTFGSVDGVKEIEAGSVIDCSGRARLFARSIGVRICLYDRLVGLVMVHESDEEDSRLAVDAAPLGWWYSVVVPGGRRVTSFMTDSVIVRERSLRRPGALAAMCLADDGLMMRHSELWSGGPAAVVIAATARLDEFTGTNWCAAGDAAATFDPLSSQGLLKALESGREAARAILQDKLATYEKWIEDDFERYLESRCTHYQANRRWSISEFWRNRMI